MRSAIVKCFVLVAVALGVPAGQAAAQDSECPVPNPSYTGPCGPTFTLPAWGDAAGWTDPSKYSTIQLADVNGDKAHELIARDDGGVEIWRFDTDLGSWRPQVDDDDLPQALRDFASPPLGAEDRGWKEPEYYSTIQTANVDGVPGEEVLARFPDGMRAYKYTPPAGGNAIDGGTWSVLSRGGPFSDADGGDDPSVYSTIQVVVGLNGDNKAVLIGRPKVIGRPNAGVLAYRWNGTGWTQDAGTGMFSDTSGCTVPSCYLTIKAGRLWTPYPQVFGRDAAGDGGLKLGFKRGVGGGWDWPDSQLGSYRIGPLSGVHDTDDCPFPTLPGRPSLNLCFPDTPILYESLRVAQLEPAPVHEAVLALATDGLRAYVVDGVGENGTLADWIVGAQLEDLAVDDPKLLQTVPSRFGSIRVGDIDGSGADEILSIYGNGLQVWGFSQPDPSKNGTFTRLQPTTPLELSGPVWEQDASHYSTLQVGDVNGDGRDDVVARGPFGIRTWFYNRTGSGGWETFKPQGTYPDFTGDQATAYVALNGLVHQTPSTPGAAPVLPREYATIRDYWTGVDGGSRTDDQMDQLRSGIVRLAACSEQQPTQPPSYKTCTSPAGVTEQAWTAVVNELLVEIYAAKEVLDHFEQLEAMRQPLFIAEDAEFPSLGEDLRLQAAAAAQAELDLKELFSGVMELVGSLVGLIPDSGEYIAAGLEAAGDIIGMLPSATPSINQQYDTTYDGVLGQFANSITDVDKAQDVLSQEVRADYGLTMLLAQLRDRGTWTPDVVGLTSVANRAFVIWAYQSLMPAVYARYQVTKCVQGNWPYTSCSAPGGSGEGIIGNPGGPNFTMFGPAPQNNLGVYGKPCYYVFETPNRSCAYTTLPSDLADKLFTPLSNTCNYQPGNAATEWTFSCTLGLNPKTTVASDLGPLDGWFPQTTVGDPVTTHTIGNSAAASIGERGRVSLSGVVQVPRPLDPSRTRVRATRVLLEPGGAGELVRLRTRRARAAGATAQRTVPVQIRRRRGARLMFGVRVAGARVHLPHSCQALPMTVTPDLEPFFLHTRLRLSDGRRTRIVTVRRQWRCVRDRVGRVSRLRPVRPEAPPRARPGLGISLRAPATVRPGTRARYRIVVTNRRRKPRGRNRTSLWHVQVHASTRQRATVRSLGEVRRQRSKTRFIAVSVPRSAKQRFCVTVIATADGVRSAGTRACAPVRRADVTGCAARSSACATPIARRRIQGALR